MLDTEVGASFIDRKLAKQLDIRMPFCMGTAVEQDVICMAWCRCRVCQVSVLSAEDWQQHCQSERHLSRMQVLLEDPTPSLLSFLYLYPPGPRHLGPLRSML